MVEKMPITPSSFSPERAVPNPDSFLHGGGQLGNLIRAFDWGATPLGPIECWPQSLKTTVSLMLNSQHPMWVGWGPEITFLYNDAYIHVLGQAKHPWALGLPAEAVWAEIWHYCGPLATNVFTRGEAVMGDDVQLFMRRAPDFLEETFYSFSYSPIRDESGAVAGLFCPSTDVSAKNIGTRRLKTLSELASKALIQKTTEAACATAASILARNFDDVPFALLYLAEPNGERVTLESFTRLPENSPLSVPTLETGANASGGIWEIGEVLTTSRPRIVGTRKLDFPFKGSADQPISQAIVLPVTTHGQERPIGVLVAGVNPTRRLDEDYQTFFQLVAGQIATAITNARALEEERKRTEALAALDRAKTTFFSNVSHELRTPLTLMLGPLEDIIAHAEGDAASDQRELATVAHRNGQRLLKLVNTLLDFSRIEAGRIQAAFEPTDLASYTAELASIFRSAAEKAGLKMEVDCPALPEAVYVDREMWEKIVLNLLSNAFKFTFEGGIALSLRWLDSSVQLTVKDSGVGIPAEELPRIFERFHRVRGSRSRTHEGTGIGLSLVQELARLHGGEVRAESREGSGATFVVSIRAGKAHLPKEQIGTSRENSTLNSGAAAFLEEAARWLPDAPPASAPEEIPPAFPLGKPGGSGAPADTVPRVLIVDDNADMRNYLSRLLADHYQVRAVADGAMALTAVDAERPDLILTDVMMPRVNGFELLAKLRSNPKTRALPVIMLSARAGEESRVEGLEAGADDYLIKPFSARELLARVSSQLAMARLRREGEEKVAQRVAELQVLNTELQESRQAAVRMMEDAVAARQALHVAKEQAETASRAKDRFLAQLSHELRTPLTPVLMTATALHEDERLPGEVRDQLGMIKHNVSLEARLIDDLLDLTRIAHGKLALQLEECDVHSLIGNVLEIVREDARERGIHISLNLGASANNLHADMARLQQVFWNLLRNAVKFTPRGGKIEIRSSNTGEDRDCRLRVEVIDNGPGFDRGAAERIFKPFEQDTRSTEGGLGLGLAIARAIVELHDGTIAAASPGVGRGATFTVELPRARVPHAALTASPTRSVSGDRLSAGEAPLRLLVVEDHDSTLQVLVRLLGRAGYRVTAAKSVSEAHAAAAAQTFDLVISDLGLPDGTGIELMEYLRATYSLHGIALSGYGMEEDVRRSHEAGFDAHLVKPIDVAELRRAIIRVKPLEPAPPK